MENKSRSLMILLGLLIVFLLYYIILIASRINNTIIINSAIVVLILSLTLFTSMLIKIISYKLDLEEIKIIREEMGQMKIEFLAELGESNNKIKSMQGELWGIRNHINSVENNINDYKKINSMDLSNTLSNETFLKKTKETMEEFRKEISTIYISKREAARIFKRKNNFDLIKESDEEATKK